MPNTEPKLAAPGVPYLHIFVVDTRGMAYAQRYRWKCSCGDAGKQWRSAARSARIGGERHVAAMERGA